MSYLHRIITAVHKEDSFGLIGRLTLLALLVHASSVAWFNGSLLPIALAGILIVPALVYQKWFWVFVLSILTVSLWLTWFVADNHQWLLAIWTLVLVVALVQTSEQRDSFLARNARFMLVLIMLLAVGQKLVSPTYINGAMFEYLFITDTNFAQLVSLVTDLPMSAYSDNRQSVDTAFQFPATDVTLISTEKVRTLALVFTYWVIGIELLIGLLLLIPQLTWQRWGHGMNYIFIITTYTFAPVYGFGALLCLLGAAATRPQQPRLYIVYIGLFVSLLLYELPWRHVLLMLSTGQ